MKGALCLPLFLPFSLFFLAITLMAPPNNTSNNLIHPSNNSFEKVFNLTNDRKFTIKGIQLLHEVPENVFFTEFAFSEPSNAPPPLIERVRSMAHKGGFLGFRQEEPSHMVKNSLGKFANRDFLSIFRFKTWWSTQWVGKSGTDLQMETQWVLFNVPEIESYALILPLIEGRFRAALQPGDQPGEVNIFAESGSTQIKAPSEFESILYCHMADNPYTILKEAYSAIRVHLGSFRLLEEKERPGLIDKFGWCTWDAFYLTVDPMGVGVGVGEFEKEGLRVRFVIIDDGWQSVREDDGEEDSSNLVYPGEQMHARLYRLEERERFKRYIGGSLLASNNAIFYDPLSRSVLMAEAVAAKNQQAKFKAGKDSTTADSHAIEVRIREMKRLLHETLEKQQQNTAPVFTSTEKRQGMKAFTEDLRAKFRGLDDIYVWQALCGTWGGVRPGSTRFKSRVVKCEPSPGLDGTMDDLGAMKVVEGGIGLVQPDQVEEFYDAMHSYLASVGITGVKVDVMQALEYVSEDYGGRVELAKRYYEGLTKSLKKNFKGTNLISSMQQCNDFFFLGTHQISMGRVGDDFWVDDPNGDPEGVFWLQGVHMVHCSYNSLWMGQMIHPDWDMFHSDHVCASFHASSRAISGGPIYVSDLLGHHDFDLLRKLVYPDGTVPICESFALPTRDCLFANPLFDMKTVLKIWNFNKYGGVIGAFNCQGAGWDPKSRRIKGYKECFKAVQGSVHVHDIEWDQKVEAVEVGGIEEYAVYLNQADSLLFLNSNSNSIPIPLNPSSFELFTFVPIKNVGNDVRFAPIGLKNMYNSGGTIQELEYKETSARMKIKGEGIFLAYSSERPIKCLVNGTEVGFVWSAGGRVELGLTCVQAASGFSKVVVQY